MGNLSNSANDVLPEFQEFLLEKKLVPDKKAPFYAHWVSRFLIYARDHELSAEVYDQAHMTRAAQRYAIGWSALIAADYRASNNESRSCRPIYCPGSNAVRTSGAVAAANSMTP